MKTIKNMEVKYGVMNLYLPLFKYFGIPTYIINITNMNETFEWRSVFIDKVNWESQEDKEEAIFLIKSGGIIK